MELKTKSMTVRLTNEADQDREYTISADVTVQDGKFVSADNGRVIINDNIDGMYVACFNVGQDESLNLNYQNGSLSDTQQVAVLNLIQEFIAAAKVKVNTATE